LWNAQSLKNKLNVLHDFRHEHDLDIILLTECWLKSDDTAVISQLENNGEYKFISKPRDHRMGGGIGCLFKSHYKIGKLETPDTTTFEHLALNLNINGNTLSMLIIYRPEPSSVNQYSLSNFFEEFTQLISHYHCKNHELLIVGDFNFHFNKPNQTHVKKLQEILDMFELKQHIHEPTHKAGNTLDLVISREGSNFLKSCSVDELLSDHCAILMEANLTKPTPPKKCVRYRKTRNINISKFKTDITNHLSPLNQSSQSGLQYLYHLVDTYESCTSILDKHAPIQEKSITIRKATPWNNTDIKAAKTAKRRAEKKWRKTRSEIDFQVFKDKRNQYNATLNNLRNKYFAEKVQKCKGNSKALFKIVNAALNRKQESPLPSHTNNEKLASEFSKHFDEKIETIRSKLQSDPIPIPNSFNGSPLTRFAPVQPERLRNLITKMATKHSSLDPLPTWLVKECLDELLPILTKIVNTSLELGIMPDHYKHAIIKPLLKKAGLELNPNNYRPISNLTFISKVIEGVVIEQLNNHFSDNALHDPRQSAYKLNHSTETLLTKVHNDIMTNGNNDKITMLVMLDLSAAFDTIDHNILLERLHNTYGIHGSAYSWFKSYLTNRTSSVIINNCTSKKNTLKYGVPQGSKLGPVLFNTYIAPVSEIARSHNIADQKYADDEQLILAFNPTDTDAINGKNKMENCINDIRMFLSENKLCNNGSKTEIILLGTKSQLSSLRINNVIIDNVEISYANEVKNLGVIFDRHMTMDKHIQKMCRSAYFNIRNISHIRKNLSKDNTKTLVNALVTPHFDYGNSLLYVIPNKLINKVQIAQNSAVRLIEKLGKYEHVSMVRKALHWLPIQARIKYKLLITTWKIINGQAPDYLKSLIKLKTPSRLLRNNNTNLLDVDNNRVNSWGRRSFSNISPSLWNSLPETLRKIDNLMTFKKHLKTHLFKLYYPDE
jgi:exonuclease III